MINTSGVRTYNNYTITSNRTNQLTASVRPLLGTSLLGSNAEALLDYEHGLVKYDSGKVAGITSDSRLDSVSLTANSVSEEGRLSWKVNVADQRINYDDNAFDDIKIRHAGLLPCQWLCNDIRCPSGRDDNARFIKLPHRAG